MTSCHRQGIQFCSLPGRRKRGETEDPTGTIPVKSRGWPPENLHPAQGEEVQLIQGGLPVRKGGRHAVYFHPQAPNPELGSGSQTSENDPFPGGVVIAVLDLDSREPLEGLLQACPGSASRQFLSSQNGDGKGGPVSGKGRSKNLDLNGRESHQR
jgi:hypothetical protein